MVSVSSVSGEFPVWGLLPRKETGALNLVSKNPSYNGKDVIIAIFDSGVDPSAPGLEFTPEKEVKVIDRIDASGAGDIDTSTVVECEPGKSVIGLTGRELKIPDTWENPSFLYHLGVVHLYNLYPQRVKERITKERKEKLWDPFHRTLLSNAQKNLQSFEKSKSGEFPSPTDHGGNNNNNNNNRPSSPKPSDDDDASTSPVSKEETGKLSFQGSNLSEKLQKENAEAELALLKQLEKKYNDLGPTYDCIVFHDGKCWRACIDNSEEGDLTKGIFLGEYRITHEYKILNTADQYTISVNVHKDGNILEIVGMCSSHGTHVASIAAGYFPETPEKNGVAPGAKIVSITIGDNRLGSMETGTALVRAMTRVMENPYYKVDIINMSYGEHAHWSNAGRLGEIAHEVVNKYGVMWVSSAGNHGPALCTVGVPPDFFTDSIIGVGAYVSPEMMMAEYSMTEKLTGRPYTWSSRGPTAAGGRGVTICAPGGAITSVPKFTLKSNQLMNGTSMASPHTAGCVALLVSAMKQKGLPYTPYSIRRAIQNTAFKLDTDIFAQGHGLIKVDKALDYLIENCEGMECKVRFELECGRDRSKGIHLRNWVADKAVDVSITVEPVIFDESRADPNEKLNLNFEFVLACEDAWVRFPPCLQLSNTVRTFKLSLDPKGLERGKAYCSSVKAFIASQPEKGAVFEVPITMVVPYVHLPFNYQFTSEPVMYKSGHIQRFFFMVPLEATYASLLIKSSDCEKVQRFTLHTVQIKPACGVTTLEYYKVLNLGSRETASQIIAVQGGLVLEICLARWWSCLSEGQLQLNMNFHSLNCSQETITFANSDGFHRVDLRVGLRSEEVLPQVLLKHHSQVLMPSESKIEVLGGERDTLPEGRVIYQLVLTYNLTVNKSGVEVTPKCSLLNHVLYESSFESQLWMLFDSGKQLLCSGDAFYSKYSCKLDKGSYVIKMHVRHEKPDLLEKLNELPLTIITKLSQEVKLEVYSSYSAAVTGGRKVQSMVLGDGTIQPLYITPPNLADKNLKSLALSAGDCLSGTMSFSKDEAVRKADLVPLKIYITDLPNKKKNNAVGADDKKDAKTFSDYEEALKDFKTTWLSKLDVESSRRLYKEVEKAYPNHLPVKLSHLQAIDNSGSAECKAEVVELARSIKESIQVEPILAYQGIKSDSRQDAAKIKTQMERQKTMLFETLVRYGNALYNEILSCDKKGDLYEENLAVMDEIGATLLKLTDASDSKVINYFINYYLARDCKALACRLLTKANDDKPSKETESRLVDLYLHMEWSHVHKFFRSMHNTKYPPHFARF